MLTCKELVAHSSDYLDGQLTLRQRLVVRAHLAMCGNCRRFIVTAPQTTPSSEVKAHRCCAPDFPGAQPMMRPDPKVKAVYLYPKPVDFRKSINGLAALVELDIKVAVFDPALFVFLNRTRNQVKILYWHRNGFCLWLKRLEAERFKTKPDAGDEAIELTVRELNQLLEGIDLWGNQPHKVLTPRFVT